MNEPDPSSPDLNKSIFTALIDAFKGLPPILSYGGLVTVIVAFLLVVTGTFDWKLLIIPALVLAAFLIHTFYRDKRHYDLEEKKEGYRHDEVMRPDPLPGPSETPNPRPTPSVEGDIPVDEWQRRYMAYLARLNSYPPYTALIDIREAGFKETKITLERIYTNLEVPSAEHLRRLPKKAMTDLDSPELEQIGKEQREPVLKAISRPENEHLVILGAPGSGKSTLVSYLALCLARDHLKDEKINQELLREQGWGLSHLRLIPVPVTLRTYAAEGLSKGQDLWTYIEAVLAAANLAGYAPYLKKQLAQGGLLLLDGLDEVDNAPKVRKALKTQVESFVDTFPNVRIIVTSRPYAYGAGWELSRFSVTRLLDFSPEQIDTFIDQWYGATGEDPVLGLGPDKAKAYADSLKAQLNPEYRSTHSLRELASNPLLLTMMVYIHRGREGGQLPHRREELYRLCINLLLELWQHSKNINLLDELNITREQLEKALQEVAFVAHKSQPATSKTADITGELLAAKLFKYRGEGAAVDPVTLIQYVRDRAGLLQQHHTKASESDDDLYRFPHRTFQEYLAALYLLRHDFPKELARLSRVDSDRWREALLLAAATQRDVPFSVWALIDKLCPEPPPASANPSAEAVSGGFLAGRALVETDLLNPETQLDHDEIGKKERVCQWQKTIVTSGLLQPSDRADAGDLLAELGDDRPGVLACDDMRLCYVPPGDFWMTDEPRSKKGHPLDILNKPYWLAQYPVTVAQFREFVHSNPDYKPAYGDMSISSPGNRPVGYVNWYDALAFCEWLNRRWGAYLPPGYRVTLPSEAEWEKAARGGSVVPVDHHATTVHSLKETLATPPVTMPNELPRREYPWGDEPEKPAAADDPYRANNEAAGVGRPTAVGSFPAGGSRLGCLDMSGNVWEWTRSYYDKKRPYRLSAEYETVNPNNRDLMLICGGAYYSDYTGCSARFRYLPHFDFGVDLGFRVAVSPFVSDR
ncbi:MAG TPA: SUMF1/EgtB/PvdO family nonheme iron enzyme [Promineifilum sp.]|nr:SUMF1/EgtB/PvdO family nonheme iron enzyme [Promineifilum sp.]HRO91695.1 SUMF1/EgtB/PvdO family nonheme iron enzyme [Promineifilum sp.]HRQ14085.1 SUMF1/EgtB/PvdO family nonheme iron enzyme [Promineifilum sp.]